MSYTASDAKQALMDKVQRVVGYMPDDMDDIVSILVGPDVRPELTEYIRKVDQETEAPWMEEM